MNGDAEDQQINLIVAEAQHLQTTIVSTSNDWDRHVATGRTIIQRLDLTRFMRSSYRLEDQVSIVSTLQRLAYYEPDSGGVQDIAEWCQTQWLRLLQEDSDRVDALKGLGQGWLSRAQSSLARIHRQEGSSSSGTSSGRPGTGNGLSYTAGDEARDAARAVVEADARVHTADYVEARGILLPSTEYFSRAVDVAERQNVLTGNLLSSAAEAYMSLGNVSYSYVNEQYFRQALIYLRRASQLPSFTLSPYLQSYLDDYGRLIE